MANAVPMLAGVGLLSMCCISSSIAAGVMSGGEEKTPTPTPTPTPTTKTSDSEGDVSTGATLPSSPPAVDDKTLYTPPPPPPPVAGSVGGFTTVQLCSPWKARDCERADAVMTCPEFKACWKKHGQAPCAGEAWFNKCGW